LDGYVLIAFAEDDTESAATIKQLLERQGWNTRDAGSPGARVMVECAALVLLLSASSGRSRELLAEVEFAVQMELPIVPIRLDGAKLTPSFEFVVGTVGFVNASDNGLSAAANQVSAALRRTHVLGRTGTSQLAEETRAQLEISYSGAPAFRPQSALRKFVLAGLGISALMGLAGFWFDMSGLLGGHASYGLVRWFGDKSSLLAGITAFLAGFWFYFAHRNLLAMGFFKSRFRKKRLILQLGVPPVNFFAAAPVIHEILAKTPRLKIDPRLFWALAWAWPLFHLCQWIHPPVVEPIDGLRDGNTLLMVEGIVNAIQVAMAPLVGFVIVQLTRAQVPARLRRPPISSAANKDLCYPTLVSWAEGDRLTAKAIRDAIDSPETPCRLAARDSSWTVNSVDSFCAIILIISSSLESSEQAFSEFERAVQANIGVIPLRIDRSPLPGQFKALQMVQWLSQEDASFETQVDMCRDWIKKTTVAKPPPESTLTVAPEQGTTERLSGRAGFYAAAAFYAVVAGLCCALDLMALGGGVAGVFTAFGRKEVYFELEGARALAGTLCLATVGFWRWRQRPINGGQRGRWPWLFAASLAVGLLSPFAWEYPTITRPLIVLISHVSSLPPAIAKPIDSALHTAIYWLFGGRVLAAAYWDFVTSAWGLAALCSGLQEAIAESARRAADARDRLRAENLTFKGIYDRLRFARQVALKRWIYMTSCASVPLAAMFFTGDVGPHGADARTQYVTSGVFQLFFAPLPVATLFVMWVGNAYRNLRAQGIETAGLTAGRAMLFLAVPFFDICLAIPILNDLLRSSIRGQQIEREETRLIRGWFLCIALYWTIFFLRFGATVLMLSRSILYCDVILVFAWAAVCFLTVRLVKMINRRQHLIWSGID
jgi:hypothetical protein